MDDGSSTWIAIVIFLLLILISAILYGFSAAIQNLSLKAVEEYDGKQQGKAERLLMIIENPHKFILTVHVVTQGMLLWIGSFEMLFVGVRLGKIFAYHMPGIPATLLGCFLAGIVFLVLTLSFGVMLPKRIGQKYAEKWAFSLYTLVYFIMLLVSWITGLVQGIVNLMLRMVGIDPHAREDHVTEEDIVSMVNEGHEQGVLQESEAQMITNIFEFDEKEVQDIMTHRTNVVAVDGAKSLNEIISFILQENYSRFPVYIGDIDNIVGILHLKDAMIFREKHSEDEKKITEIPGLVREVEFIPETRTINVVFKDMQREKQHMQIVIDEYGQTSGIVAMEDILEEIVGNIQDEYDEEEENIQKKSEQMYLVNGLTTLDEITEVLGIEFEDEDVDTLNGYLISKFDRILSGDEHPQIEINGTMYQVLEVQNKMISKVMITISNQEIEKETEESKGV